MAHPPTVRHYYAVYNGWSASHLLTSSFSPPLHPSSSFPLLHHTPLLLSGELLLSHGLLLSGELLLSHGLLLSGELLLSPGLLLSRDPSGELLLPPLR